MGALAFCRSGTTYFLVCDSCIKIADSFGKNAISCDFRTKRLALYTEFCYNAIDKDVSVNAVHLPDIPEFFVEETTIMATKITVIGAGSVGSAITNDIMVQGFASEIVLIDVNKEKAFGEALDIYQGVPFCSPAVVHAGDYPDAADSDIVIITSGLPRKPGQSRLELAQTNVDILKQITPEIVRYAPNAIYIIVSNPVDVLTYVFTRISGIPEEHIMGSGTVLDTSRLQTELARRFHISPKNVHAHVYGEHGDSSFIPWSLAMIANNHINEYKMRVAHGDTIHWDPDYEEVEQFVKTSGAQVIKAKGATCYAVAIAVCHICKCIISGVGTALTVSTMMHGEYGVEDVCLSALCLVGENGVHEKIVTPLTWEETKRMQASAGKLKEIITGLKI